MKYFLTGLLIIFAAFLFMSPAYGATEFVSIVDPDNATGTDYTSLSTWESGNQTDLTAAATQVFSGTRTNAIADDATVYLCRSGVYQTHYGTLVHVTATQILIESITGAATEQSGDIWYTNDTCNSANYFTLSNGGDSAIAVASARASAGTADTTAVTIDGWTTSATNYIKVWTDPGLGNRHSGKWDSGKYKLVGAPPNFIYVLEEYVNITGLQFEQTVSGTRFFEVHTASAGVINISNSIIRATVSGTNDRALINNVSAATLKAHNNLIYGFSGSGAVGIRNYLGGTIYAYNNTIINSNIGISTDGSAMVAKNNIVQEAADGYSGTFTSSDYNISSVASDTTGGAHDKANTTVSFIDPTNKDFHLASTDVAAKDAGTNLSADANLAFSTDIDSNNRPSGSWDIGADETATQIYRSVGPSATSALATGSGNNLTISGSTATFATALADNIGVGDAVQYDDDADSDIDANDSIAFITARASSTSYTVKTAAGAAPTAVTNDQDWSIFRAYTTLANAETGTENTGIDADLRNFDTWSGGKDLVTNNEQWNIAAYANGTTADTIVADFDGWTTAAQNFIKVYTPATANEVGTTQRHSGKWDSNKYIFNITSGCINSAAIIAREDFVRIEGLQISTAAEGNCSVITVNSAVSASASEHQIFNNIIKATSISGTYNRAIRISGGDISKIWNNIIYDFTTGYGINVTSYYSGTVYIYNNTLYDNYYGIHESQFGNIVYAKNNIVQGATDSYYSSTGWGSGSDYNISNTAEAIPSPSYRDDLTTTVTFADSGNDDFHLATADTMAKNVGIDLSADSNLPFDSDIDGENRSGAGSGWDIGADEQRSNPNPVNINRNVQFKPGTTFRAIQ